MKSRKINNLSDNELIELIQKGDKNAFTKLYEKYWEALIESAYKVLANKDAAQDVVQEVFIDLWNKRKSLFIDKILPYLHQSVRYAVFRYIKKSKIIINDIEFLKSTPSVNTTEEDINFQEVSGMLEESISELPEQCQKVFRLSRYENLSNKEIANRLNISVRTVDNHISKALKTLRYRFVHIISILLVLLHF